MPNRPAWDQAARRQLAERLRDVRSRLAAIGGAEARRGALPTVAQIEAVVGQLGRLVDRVESAGFAYGAWVTGTSAVGVLAALEVADACLDGLVSELAATVLDLGARPVTPERLAVAATVVAEVAAAFEDRLAILAADVAPATASTPTALAGVAPGQRVLLEGEEHAVTVLTRWNRGDTSLQLADPRRRLTLWQDVGVPDVVLFEDQPLTAPPNPATGWQVEGVAFHPVWSDDRGGSESGPAGREPVEAQRWLFASPDGVWGWLERRAGHDITRRGMDLAAGDWVLL